LEDALAPLYALLSTREARGENAQRAIGRMLRDICRSDKTDASSNENASQCVYFFSLAPATVPLPLGWMLSNRAAEAMQLEMNDKGLSAKNPDATWNQPELKRVVAALHGIEP
jgi:hypothetical protein